MPQRFNARGNITPKTKEIVNGVEERIRAQFPKLTKKQRKISKFIIENMEEAAFLSCSRLAQKAEVSEASVIRFCVALDYEGYGGLQKDLQAWIKSKITPLIKIKKSISMGQRDSTYLKVIEADEANFEALRENIPERQLNQAVQLMIKARKVYVIGMRSSYAPAFLLNHYLNQVGVPAELLDPQGGRLLDRVIHISPKDMIVGISFPRYFKQTVEVLQYAKSRHYPAIVITDNLLSPAAQYGDVVITAKYHTPIPFLSYVSVISLINCLIFGIVMKKKSQSVALLVQVDKMLEKWDSFIPVEHMVAPRQA